MGAFVVAVLSDSTTKPRTQPASRLQATELPAYLAFRANGRKVFDRWEDEGDQLASIQRAVDVFRTSASQAERAQVDSVELCLVHRFHSLQRYSEEAARSLLANVARGVMGIELSLQRESTIRELIAPTTTIATNRPLRKQFDEFCRRHNVSETELRTGSLRLRQFDATQILIQLANGHERVKLTAIQLFRGNQVVPLESVTPESLEQLERLLGDYLIRSVQSDGRMRYIYYPSRGKEDLRRNNQIRQWMATLALCRLADHRKDASIFDLAERNIRYNLSQFYRKRGPLGLIDDNGKVKLGVVALAVLAISSHPKRKQFHDVEDSLWATIDFLWQKSGDFRTFLVPKDRNDLHNFYPGEALFAWGVRYEETKSDQLLGRFMRSFAHYRQWHRQNRNPAFIPWHTQAYYAIWRQTDNEQLRDFIFEINDWLLAIQQWDNAPAPDCQGRFYDPTRPFGPPHASATGVYLEGLCDALALAHAVCDELRMETYRRALRRGLRSVSQLTLQDDSDMFYVQKRDLLRGGVRTTVYDNVVRIDNVQHNLLAILKLLAHPLTKRHDSFGE